MANNPSSQFPSESETGLREKLIRSIWLHGDKYCYLFEADGSYRLLSTDRRGRYTISPDGYSVLLAWTTDSFTETLSLQADGRWFMSGSPFVEIGTRAIATALPSPSKASSPTPERANPDSIPYWLPEDFRVFTNDQGSVGTHSGGGQGIEPRILPTVNQYKGADGGYVAFYSRDPAKAVYSVGGGIYVVGQIRLKGRYIGRIFHPEGYLNQDISAAPEFKALCRKTFGVEGWAGGDTGGWFGAAHSRHEARACVEEIAYPVTLEADQEVQLQTQPLRSGSTVTIMAISHSSSFSFNLMAGQNFAYHFNPRLSEGQIVQNTHIRCWGPEERLLLPSEMELGHQFALTITVQETELVIHLNDTLLCRYRHRIPPLQIDGLRLICVQGRLQVLSVKISESEVGGTCSDSDLDINSLVRPAWKPSVIPGDGNILASKFSGRPWLATDEIWPTCPCCAEPMQLFFQLNLSELPEPVREEFGTGLLQMFHCIASHCEPAWESATRYYGGRVPYLIQNIRIRLVQPLGSGSTPPLPAINGEEYGTDFPALTITNWLEIEDYPDLDDLIAEVYGWERAEEQGLWEEAVQRLGLDDLDEYDELYPTDNGDKLGGYPRWVQGMECPGCPVCQAPMRQVFQLASCENLSYMFGDMGIAHVLQCKTHKDQFAFVWSGC